MYMFVIESSLEHKMYVYSVLEVGIPIHGYALLHSIIKQNNGKNQLILWPQDLIRFLTICILIFQILGIFIVNGGGGKFPKFSNNFYHNPVSIGRTETGFQLSDNRAPQNWTDSAII